MRRLLASLWLAVAGCYGSAAIPSFDAAVDRGRGRDAAALDGSTDAGSVVDAGADDGRLVDAGLIDGGATSCDAPVPIGGVTFSGLPVAIAADRGYVHVSLSLQGMITIDARDPTAMTALGELAFEQPGRLAAAGDWLAITSHNGDRGYHVNILDVAMPSVPRMLYALDAGHLAERVMLTRDLLVDVGYAGVATWRLDPSGGALLGAVALPAGVGGVAERDGGRVAVASGSGTTWLVDIASPSSPFVVATGESGADARAIAVLGDRVYVGGSTLAVLVADGDLLRVVDSVPYGGDVEALATWRGALLVTGRELGFVVADAADPSLRLGELGGGAWALAVDGDIAFMTEGGGFGPGAVYAIDLCP